MPRPFAGRLARLDPLPLQAVDVLDDHHRVVHQHAHTEHQAEHAEHVEGAAEEEHRPTGHEQRERNRQGDDQRRRDAAQEEKEHADGQQTTEQAGVAQTLDGIQDRLGGIFPDQHLDSLQLGVGADLLDPFFQAAHRGHRVRRGLLVDVKPDGEVAVQMSPVVQNRFPQIDRGDIAETQAGDLQG